MQQKYLRPRTVHAGIDDDVADAAGAQLLRLGREPQKAIDFACREQVQRLERGVTDPTNILRRVEPDLGRYQRQQRGSARLQADGFAPQFCALGVLPFWPVTEAPLQAVPMGRTSAN
jgi:hypothetical protein